eukprot:snap_masked-scaffold_1-processed-gene-9.29-mRNA-1 protein AED:1.00 eAED:1.00 QI:0/-1/0/0/-1/1/1/0/76
MGALLVKSTWDRKEKQNEVFLQRNPVGKLEICLTNKHPKGLTFGAAPHPDAMHDLGMQSNTRSTTLQNLRIEYVEL